MPEKNVGSQVQVDGRLWLIDGFYVSLPEGEFEPSEAVLNALDKVKLHKDAAEDATITMFAWSSDGIRLLCRERDMTMLRKKMQKLMVSAFRQWNAGR